jgi:hypothetical protein
VEAGSMTGADLARLMEPVARALLGAPNSALSQKGKNKLRFGKHGSLVVDLGNGTWYSHEDNKGGGVLDLIEREKGLKGVDRFKWLEQEGYKETEPARAKIVKTYDYVDEHGEVLYQVVRLEPKTFRQRRPDPANKSQWIWNLQGVTRVAYRLPDVIEALANDRFVLIVEGEKDVDRLWSIGIPATCNSEGAGKFRAELIDTFAGADVIVVNDNDEPGRNHADDVASRLIGTAKRVRRLDLAAHWSAPDKADVSDWLAAGHEREELDKLIENAPDFAGIAADPAADATDGYGKAKKMALAAWLDKNKPVEQMTWCPGHPPLVRDRLVLEGGFIERAGVTTFNLYRPPLIIPGDPGQAAIWLELIKKVFGDYADHIVRWLAHRLQRPHEKVNHALVFGGAMGIGKDSILEPVKRAVGPWNFSEISPPQIMGRFNGFLKAVILRVSETRDLGDTDRYSFYERMKIFTAAPPDTLRVDEKHTREYGIFNVCGVIHTTNHKTDGIYLPADDRRHFVAWSELTRDDFAEGYWDKLWAWYDAGGAGHVAAYLRGLDLSAFNPKAPPTKTDAFWEIVDANRAPEDAELADLLDGMGNPQAITLADLVARAAGGIYEWIIDRKNRRAIPHRLEQCGYVPVRNPGAKDGHWKICERRQAVYALKMLPLRERIAAATRLSSGR